MTEKDHFDNDFKCFGPNSYSNYMFRTNFDLYSLLYILTLTNVSVISQTLLLGARFVVKKTILLRIKIYSKYDFKEYGS